jgi:predicted dehydrogenase
MKALEMGYDILLEKPIAQSWEQCHDILVAARKHNSIVGVGHVLRYSPYFRKIKEEVESGRIGKIVNIELIEPVGYDHIAHSYVRGPWRRVEDSNPILLAKSCHDLDIISWLIGKPCKRVSSFGALSWFKKENAPEGSTVRCTDGCLVESDCPWSSRKIYLEGRGWLTYLQLEEETDERILQAIKEGPYGRCVFKCDNNVLDHQVVIMDFEDQITASFTMAFTRPHGGGRFIRVMGTKGDIVGDWENVMTTDFLSLKTETWNVAANSEIKSGHGGGDDGLTRNFIQAVTRKDESLLTSNLEASMASHFIGFNAEKSRLTGKVIDLEKAL